MKLSYELCKKLKDAGFPQKEGVYLSDVGVVKPVAVQMMVETDQAWYCPTLSELIKACGRRDFKLCQTYEAIKNNMVYFIEIPGDESKSRYKTLEEAVANLYLELNKKEYA